MVDVGRRIALQAIEAVDGEGEIGGERGTVFRPAADRELYPVPGRIGCLVGRGCQEEAAVWGQEEGAFGHGTACFIEDGKAVNALREAVAADGEGRGVAGDFGGLAGEGGVVGAADEEVEVL